MSVFLLILPILLLILAGYVAERASLFPESSNAVFTKFIFFIAMPCQLFIDFSKTPINQSINVPYICAFALGILITGLAIFLFSRFFLRKSLAESALNLMGSSQVNTAYFAIPIFLLVFNNATPVIPILIFQVVILTTIVLFMIEHDSTSMSSKKQITYLKIPKRIGFIVLKNPIIMASLLGLLASFYQLQPPKFVNNFLSLLGVTAAPLALFSLGQSLCSDLKKIYGRELLEIATITLTKLVLLPIIAFFVGKYVFQLSPYWLASLVIMSAMPAPKNMFIFSVRYKLDTQKASTVVAVTTLLSLITLNILLIIFRHKV